MVLVEAGIQQPVAVGVTRQKVHGAVAAGGRGVPRPSAPHSAPNPTIYPVARR